MDENAELTLLQAAGVAKELVRATRDFPITLLASVHLSIEAWHLLERESTPFRCLDLSVWPFAHDGDHPLIPAVANALGDFDCGRFDMMIHEPMDALPSLSSAAAFFADWDPSIFLGVDVTDRPVAGVVLYNPLRFCAMSVRLLFSVSHRLFLAYKHQGSSPIWLDHLKPNCLN